MFQSDDVVSFPEIDNLCPPWIRESQDIPSQGRCFFSSQCEPSDNHLYSEEAKKGHGYCCPVMHVCNPKDGYTDKKLHGCPPINQCDPLMENASMVFTYFFTDCAKNPMKHYANEKQKCTQENPDFPNNWVEDCFWKPGKDHATNAPAKTDVGYDCPDILWQMCDMLKKGFDEIDADKNGKVNTQELSEIMPAEYMCVADKDGDNQMSLQEYLDTTANAMEGTVDETCIYGSLVDPSDQDSNLSPLAPSDSVCQGVYTAWDAGWGDCKTYESTRVNHWYCSGDFFEGVSANKACPECGKCELADRNLKGEETMSVLETILALYKMKQRFLEPERKALDKMKF